MEVPTEKEQSATRSQRSRSPRTPSDRSRPLLRRAGDQRLALRPRQPAGSPPPWRRGDIESSRSPQEPVRSSGRNVEVLGSETEEEQESRAEERTEDAFSIEDKRVDLRQQTSPGDLRPRPSRKLFSPDLPKEEFTSRFRQQRLAIQRREEAEAKEREREKARAEKQKVRGAFNEGEGPVIGIDWHKTLAGENGRVSHANRSLLSVLIQCGYRVVIVSFASSRQRQEQVLAGRRDLQHNIGYPLRLILCPRKLSTDPEGKESLTGDTVCKSEAVLQERCSIFVDDQGIILRDIQQSQRHRPRKSATLCLQAETSHPEFTLRPLRDLIRDTPVEDLPTIV